MNGEPARGREGRPGGGKKGGRKPLGRGREAGRAGAPGGGGPARGILQGPPRGPLRAAGVDSLRHPDGGSPVTRGPRTGKEHQQRVPPTSRTWEECRVVDRRGTGFSWLRRRQQDGTARTYRHAARAAGRLPSCPATPPTREDDSRRTRYADGQMAFTGLTMTAPRNDPKRQWETAPVAEPSRGLSPSHGCG